MEELVGPEVEVILTLKQVTDLAFITTPVLAVATLFDNHMETDIHEPDTIIKFNTDLVWESNKMNIKRMRNNNIPIKLNLYKYFGPNHKEKFGYVILNLRTAQYIPRGKSPQITEEYIKVLGLGKEAKGSTPMLLMSLRIQDKIQGKRADLFTEDNIVSNQVQESTVVEANADTCRTTAQDGETKTQKLGDLRAEEGFLIENVQKSPTLRSPRTKHSLTADFEEKQLTMTSNEKRNCSGDQHAGRNYIQAYHNFKLEIQLENILWLKRPPKFRFRFHQSRSEILSTAHPEINIDKVDEIVELCDIRATFSFVETPTEFRKLVTTVPPVVSISCNMQNRPVVIARGVLDTDKLMYSGDETIHKIELIDVKNHETVGKLTYAAVLTDCGPQVMKDVTLKLRPTSNAEETDIPPVIFENVTDKIVDELEDWKERQKQLFQHEFTSKLQKEMSELRSEWMDRRNALEQKVNERMEQCKQLGESLIDATEDVKRKNNELLEKERHLELTRNELESRYLKMLTEKNEEINRLQSALQEAVQIRDGKILILEKEKHDIEKRLKSLLTENDELKQSLRVCEAEVDKCRKASLSQEQTATLLQDLKTMQEKLETANNSKLFFKEQWGRAVREIHRIKSEYTKNIQVQLQYRKDELKRLGLEQLFINEKNQNGLERDDMLEAKDFLGSDFETRSAMHDMEFPYKARANYESYKTNMDIVKENNTYLLKFNQESEERLKKLIEERDHLLCEGKCQIDDENIVRLNKEIRHLLDH